MIVKNGSAVIVRESFPFAQAVYLLGEFNRWSTTATPMFYVGGGVWEAKLWLDTGDKRLAYFVWWLGNPFGEIIHHDSVVAPASVTSLDSEPV
jgi:hypothetical protein